MSSNIDWGSIGDLRRPPAQTDGDRFKPVPAIPYHAINHAILVDASKQPGEAQRVVSVDLNPNEFVIKGGSEYARLDVPGLSHQVIQWSHTKSKEFEFTLEWDYAVASEKLAQRGRSHVDAMLYIWLLGFLEPIEAGRGPAPMQIYWPRFLWVAGVVPDVEITIQRWSAEGVPMAFTAKISFLEHRRNFMWRDRFLAQRMGSPENPADVATPPELPSSTFEDYDVGRLA